MWYKRTCFPINLSMQLMLDSFLYVHHYFISDLCFIFSGKPAVITFCAYSKDQIISILQQRFEVRKCVDCWWYLHPMYVICTKYGCKIISYGSVINRLCMTILTTWTGISLHYLSASSIGTMCKGRYCDICVLLSLISFCLLVQ